MYYVTSDLHFNHKNILTYEAATRPFENVEAMNAALIENWNSIVNEDDTVFVLGDMFMGLTDTIPYLLSQLKGYIIYVRGNHDTPARLEMLKKCGIEIHDIYYLPYKDAFFIMCHFPLSEEFARLMRLKNHELIYLYGHVHSNAPKGFRCDAMFFHAGADTNDLHPVNIEDIYQQHKAALKEYN